MQRRTALALCLLALLAGGTRKAEADVFGSISNAINSATNAVSNGLQTAVNATTAGITTATDAVGNGLSTAANATTRGLNTALNATGKFINTATDSVKDAYQTSRDAVTNVTSSAQRALAPAADRVEATFENLGDSIANVTTGTYQGVVQYGRGAAQQQQQQQPASSTDADATSAPSILAALTANSTGFISVANSLLVALGSNRSANVSAGIRDLLNNRTGEAAFPPQPQLNDSVATSFAQAVVTALVTATNYTVSVGDQRVNGTQVVNAYVAGLQDAVTPCARNVSGGSTANTTGAYFGDIAQKCCFLVAAPLRDSVALADANTVGSQLADGLARSQTLGQAPALDLTRCADQAAQTS